MIDLCRQHFPEISAGAYDDPRTRIVIADGTKFVAETDERFDVIMIDSTDPVGPGAVLFTREFYAGCRALPRAGGLLVTQNGLPFLQASELKQSVGYFRELFSDACAYLATTPSYFGGPMSYGWATDDAKLKEHKRRKIERRYEKAGAFPTRYWRPDVHVAAFALPIYVQELVEGSSHSPKVGHGRACPGIHGFLDEIENRGCPAQGRA